MQRQSEILLRTIKGRTSSVRGRRAPLQIEILERRAAMTTLNGLELTILPPFDSSATSQPSPFVAGAVTGVDSIIDDLSIAEDVIYGVNDSLIVSAFAGRG